VNRIVKFGAGTLADLGELLAELGLERPMAVTTRRGAEIARSLPIAGVYDGVRPHVPVETVGEAAAAARKLDADGLVALGGGSAIDTAKAVTHELLPERELRTIAVPTTYAGAEWTPYYGMLLAPGRKRGGGDDRAKPVAAIYDPELTVSLPVPETVGTAMNALAHCAEAYYSAGHTDRGDRHADTGAAAIAYALPLVCAKPDSLYARTRLQEGAFRASLALEQAGMGLGHAMAQALGGHFGLPQGSMNALTLPVALEFNEPTAPEAVARFGVSVRAERPAERVRELARLGGFERLREFGVPERELDEVAADVVLRAGARANPRPASAGEVEELLRSIW
jgi:maleylacetate reductase